MEVSDLLESHWSEEELRIFQHHLMELRESGRKIAERLDAFFAETDRRRAERLIEEVRNELYDHLIKDHLGEILTVLDAMQP